MRRSILRVVLVLVAAPILVVAALAAIVLGLWLYATLFPVSEAVVKLPRRDAQVRVQVWGDTLSDGRFEIVVETLGGLYRQKMWEDWGPAQRTNLYLTPEGYLVAIGGGEVAAVVAMPKDSAPYWVSWKEREKLDSENWRYLGAVDGHHLRFYPPSKRKECIALFGEGSVPYRARYQEKGFCHG